MNKFYTDYSQYLQRIFGNVKVQKISVNTDAGCPNRDGTIGKGGCIYCDNRSFTPSYCKPKLSVVEQIEIGKTFFGRKYPKMKYLAYFQSYTNTYMSGNSDVENIIRLYKEALQAADVVGLVIGTRPDCMPDELLYRLASINNSGFPVIIEYGAESSHDETLKLINRGHTWQQVCDAVHRTHDVGLSCGLHLIIGLPGEDNNSVLQTINKVIEQPVDTLKLHQLQVIKGTALQKMLETRSISIKEYQLEEYIALCASIVRIVPEHIAIERFLSQSPPEMVIKPHWGLKNYQFVNLLNQYLERNFEPNDRNIRLKE